MLSTIHFQPSTTMSELALWHEFMRRVTYHIPTVTKYHEYKLVPSYQTLVLHCKRANYVMKLFLSAPLTVSPFLPCFTQFGWHVKSEGGTESICITWDSENGPDPEEEEGSSSGSEEDSD